LSYDRAMPTRLGDGGAPIVQFDPQLEISPFTVFRWLREGGRPLLLVDARPAPAGRTFRDALPWPGEEWEPPEDRDVVLFDEDESLAAAQARRLQAAGFERVRALFGGLELYEFSLPPDVVGTDTYLVALP
jgi:hypothetical protein